ncbi:hypothetical protein Pyn_07599 [Prunus yedoensis var. nudiflora]|uniref:BHLH domain-containing protein n=1 Tax=Prunus yedoensis var. nudiflora TaxID=2094558 RepID=A0A314XEM9_PRUYE|nr:hypothetical protein Pyn_07599 [Prunus yedoensis var. nudiflora]
MPGKLRRNRLNERFLELVSVLDPGRLPKTDKAAILTDAVRVLTQLQSESKKLKETIESLQANIKELKAEKSELRDEKQRLRVEKEKLEQQVIAMSAQNGLLPRSPAISTAFAVRAQASGNKLMPFISYPGVLMRQFMSPDVIDISRDHILRPPTA